MMRAMRENAKYVFYVLAIAFVGWMVFDVGMGITGQGQYGTSDVVLKVDGDKIRVPEYQQAVSNATEQYRQQTGTSPATREDQRALEDEVINQLIQDRLLRREYRRLGIRVTPAEIIGAARTSPLPELYNHPDLQTDGQFDPEKYQRLLSSSADPQLLQYIEGRYRDQIPQYKLTNYVTADVYVPDPKLWRIWRDRYDSVTVSLVRIGPQVIPDDSVQLTDADLERFLRANEDKFRRPAVAHLSFVAQPRRPDASDTAAARARVLELRAEVTRGGADRFAEVARRESADTVSGAQGGDLGWFPQASPPFVRQFTDAVKRLPRGRVSEPVVTEFGYHLIQVTDAKKDSLKARHILVPIELTGAHRDYVESRADTLDRDAAEQTEGSRLDSAAAALHLPVGKAAPLREGERMQLGVYVIPDVGVWAFEAQPGETSPVIEAKPAYYVFRLDSLTPGGVPPLAEIREAVLLMARQERRLELARAKAAELGPRIRSAPDFAAAAAAAGVAAVRVGPITRLTPGPVLSDEPLVLGALFSLRAGERSDLIQGTRGAYVFEVLSRRTADSTAWLAQREQQRREVIDAARQARVRQYLQNLRDRATVVDRRQELFRTAAQQEAAAGTQQ